MSTITLCCVVIGENPYENAFNVKVNKTEAVSELKMLNGPTRSVPVLRDRSSGRTGTNCGPRSRGTVQDRVKTDIGPTFRSYKILSKNERPNSEVRSK